MSFFNIDDEDDQQDEVTPTPVAATAPGTALAPEQKKAVYDSIAAKYGTAANTQDIDDAKSGADRSKLASSLAEAVAGYGSNLMAARGMKPTSSSGFFQGLRQDADKDVDQARQGRKDRMDKVLTEDKLAYEDETRGNQRTDRARMLESQKREDDPKSQESATAQALAKKLMPSGNFEGMSATKLKASLPYLEKMYSAEQQRLGRIDSLNMQRQNHQDELNRRADEKTDKEQRRLDELKVGEYGTANTADDAKKLKDAAAIKESFDKKMAEMIELRKSKGAELWDREAVERGKQLSKELLLDYKNLKSLGVLSKTDENIVNQVIPADPLQWNAASLMGGQDPTMTGMQKFRDDTNADFSANLKTRLRDGGAGYAAAHPPVKDEPAGGAGEAIAGSGRADPQVATFARDHKMTYEAAKALLVKRGYTPNE